MSDEELIRRGDAKDAAWEADSLELSTHGAGKIEARINAIPAASATQHDFVQPTVKPLVWRSNGKGRVCADTPFGLYEVEHGRYGMRLLHGGSFMQDDLQGIEAAKAAAQTDYEARILSALDMQPTVSPKQLAAQPDDVAALVEALEFYAAWDNWMQDERGVSLVDQDEGKTARTILALIEKPNAR